MVAVPPGDLTINSMEGVAVSGLTGPYPIDSTVAFSCTALGGKN